MAIDLNALAGRTAVTTVEFMGLSAQVTYDPMYLTQENYNRARAGDEAFVTFFCELVKDWDVKRGPKKVQLKPTAMEGIPMPFLRACYTSILADGASGASEQGKASSAG